MENMPSILSPDFGLMFWMLLAFLIVFAILSKYAFPAITKGVDNRKKYIDEALLHAKEANEKLADLQAQGQKIIADAHQKCDQLIKEAENTGNSIIASAKNKAQEESAQILSDAKNEIQAEKEKALHDIKGEMANISVAIAERLLRQELGEKDKQEAYIQRIINQL